MIFGEKVEGTLRGEYTFLTYLLQTNNKKTLEQTKKKKKICFLFINCNYVDSIWKRNNQFQIHYKLIFIFLDMETTTGG